MKIILASGSPRRKEILAGLGVDFSVLSADTDESCSIPYPEEYAMELARRKAEAALEILRLRGEDGDAVIISADTVVACEGEILGKPRDEADARRMIALLSGRTHVVATGVAVTVNGVTHTDCSVTKVTVDEIPEKEIDKYVSTKEPYDKAGSYAIQGGFSKWISGIDGCYFGVVGLPVNVLSRLFYRAVGCYPDEI